MSLVVTGGYGFNDTGLVPTNGYGFGVATVVTELATPFLGGPSGTPWVSRKRKVFVPWYYEDDTEDDEVIFPVVNLRQEDEVVLKIDNIEVIIQPTKNNPVKEELRRRATKQVLKAISRQLQVPIREARAALKQRILLEVEGAERWQQELRIDDEDLIFLILMM